MTRLLLTIIIYLTASLLTLKVAFSHELDLSTILLEAKKHQQISVSQTSIPYHPTKNNTTSNLLG